jgi:molecular chaperone Hsp33
MIKKNIGGESLKERLLASAKDRLYNFLLADGAIRGAILNGTRMINEMRANHELGILETLVLGRAYLAAGLISANLKGADSTSLKIECSGPIRGLSVEANAFGEVRGFLKNVPIPIDKPMQDRISLRYPLFRRRQAAVYRKSRPEIRQHCPGPRKLLSHIRAIAHGIQSEH